MNLIQPLDDVQWQKLIQHTADFFNDLTIKRGFQYYKQNRVSKLQLDENHITAAVKGRQVYQVNLVIDFPGKSRCTCPLEKNCKHIIAVLLKTVVLQGRSVHALVNAHSTQLIQSGEASFSNEGAFAGFSHTDSKQTTGIARFIEQAEKLPEIPVSAWHQLFSQCITALGISISNSLYSKHALQAIFSIKPVMSDVMDALFELHAHLFVLEKLVKQPQSHNPGSGLFMGYHTQIAAENIQNHIEGLLASGRFSIPVTTEYSLRVSETLAYLRENMLSEARNHFFFSHIYHYLWIHGIAPSSNERKTDWYSEELEQLKSAETKLGNAYSRFAGMLAQSLMYFFLSEDEKAWELLRAADKGLYIQPEQLIHFLEMLAEDQNWPRLTAWLSEIGPLLANYRNHNLNSYMAYWEQVIQHRPEAETSLWNTLTQMLPYSKEIYQESLLTHGKWQQWIDFQMSIGKEPLEFRVSVLAPIEKNAPELLLPFFHQAVERYIVQKNRASYKSAVKLLKRLSKLYKKTKQEDRWEAYITALAERHSRLRALQEELRRGKLIS